MDNQKEVKKKKPFYQKWWFILIVAFAIIGFMNSEDEEAAEEKPAEREVAAVEKEKPGEVKKEEKPKEEKPKEKKPSKEEVEKLYYTDEVKPQIDSAIKEYDDIWTALWVPTFNGLGDGTTDVHGAYGSMKQLELKYKELMTTISDINGDELSKPNKKFLNKFKEEFRTAAMMRKAGGEDARKMIDVGTFSPSEVDKVMSTVGIADGAVMRALASQIELEGSLGISE